MRGAARRRQTFVIARLLHWPHESAGHPSFRRPGGPGIAASPGPASRSLLWPVPEKWTAEAAAAFPVTFFTAYFAYWKAGLLEKPAGARVLIHAVAGGVGTAAVQIGKILGVEMYGTSSS